MDLEVTQPDTPQGVAIVQFSGEMDIGELGVDQLRQAFDELVDGGVRNVVLDLSEATYIVSRGFGQMLVALARLRTRGGDLRIAGAHGSVLAAADMVGLNSIIRFYPTREEAIGSFEGAEA